MDATRLEVALGSSQYVSALVLSPPTAVPTRAILVCAHGGSYSKEYWHLAVRGYPAYDFAQYFAQLGFLVIAYDRPGTGQSWRPDDPWTLGSVEIAAAQHAFVEALCLKLSLPAVPRIGIGHSLGAMLTLRQQGQHHSFEAIAPLGWTNFGPQLGDAWNRPRSDIGELIRERLQGIKRSAAERLLASEASAWLQPLGALEHARLSRDERRALYYGNEVPDELMAMDEAASGTVSGALLFSSLIDDIVRDEAASIDVPVFLGLGQRDISVEPWKEPSCYPSCPDLTLHVLPRSGHCHNFAPTRAEQWTRLRDWIITVIGEESSG
jgi:pimeloyl-ACP methyl ester carboxylesterase